MGLIVALFGAAFIIVSSRVLFPVLGTRLRGVRTQGTVIDNRQSFTSSGQSSWAPVIRFATPDGRTVEFVSRMSTPVVYEVGRQVPIVYQPSKPEEAVLATALGTWFIPTLLLVVGVVALVAGLIWFVLYRGVTLSGD